MIDRKTHNFVKEVKELKVSMDDMKSAQPFSGDSWVVYRNVTDNTWDITGFPPPQQWTYSYWIVRLVPDFPDVEGFGAIYPVFTFESEINPAVYEINRVEGDQYAWYVAIGNEANPNIDVNNQYFFKAYIFSTQSGTVTIEPTTI